jgi:hypothetical protein
LLDADISKVPRNKILACGWAVTIEIASPPTWKPDKSEEGEKVKPPQGAIPSLLALDPSGIGYSSVKWAVDSTENSKTERSPDDNRKAILRSRLVRDRVFGIAVSAKKKDIFYRGL